MQDAIDAISNLPEDVGRSANTPVQLVGSRNECVVAALLATEQLARFADEFAPGCMTRDYPHHSARRGQCEVWSMVPSRNLIEHDVTMA